MDQYEKMSEAEKLGFLAELANMYYELNMTQSEIADKLSTTRFKVSKLLQEARDKNIVEITIHQPRVRLSEIENLFKQHFDLKECIIMDNKVLPYDETISSLGKFAAEYLDSIVFENSVIGLLWGKTIFNVIKHLRPKKKLPITAVQVIGAAAKDDTLTDAPELIRRFASVYGGKYKYLYAPLYIDNDYGRKSLMQEPVINDTLFWASKSDIILTGIGTVDAVFSSTLWANYLMRSRHYDFSKQKAVGCVYGYLFDSDGNDLDVDINKKVIGLDLETFKQVNYIIGVAAGKFKAEAILGALRGKYINVLITDDSTALKVLSLAGVHLD